MAIDFPTAPTSGQAFTDTVSGVTFTWNGTGWTQGGSGGGGGTPVDAYTKVESDAKYVELTGDTMSGDLRIGPKPASVLYLDYDGTVASANGQVNFANNGLQRWQILSGGEAETGIGNVGSDFMITRSDDAGAALGSAPLTIDRATGTTTFNGDITLNGVLRGAGPNTGVFIENSGNNAGLWLTSPIGLCNDITGARPDPVWPNPRWLMRFGNNVPEGGGNTGSAFELKRYADDGVDLGVALTIARENGFITLHGGAELPASNSTGGVDYSSPLYFKPPGYSNIYIQGSHQAGLTAYFNVFIGGVTTLHTEAGGNLTITGNGWKPGGGEWAATSDARIKTVLGDYTQGLDAILQLTPRRYVYKGNDIPLNAPPPPEDDPDPRSGEPHPRSGHYTVAAAAKEFIGLVAQDVETIMPEMVTLGVSTIDGEPVTDLRRLDPTALTYALINAVKELSAKVAALEAAQTP